MPVFEQDAWSWGAGWPGPCTTKPDVGSGRPQVEEAMKAQEWTWFAGTTNAPSGTEEAELLELGRRVAMERGYQSVLLDDPADYA
jgi:hypothetical protein